VENNRCFHRMLTDGVDISYQAEEREVHDKVWLIDIDDLANNDWLAVNQFTVVEGQKNRCPDILIFINGLPLAIIELKTRPLRRPRFAMRLINFRLTKRTYRLSLSLTN